MGECEKCEALQASAPGAACAGCVESLQNHAAALEQELSFAEKAKAAIRGERDHVSGPWWASFDAMLSEAERNEIGLTEDRGQALCTTRLAAAYSLARERIEAVRAIWAHIELPNVGHRGEPPCDPGPPACLRCKIERALR